MIRHWVARQGWALAVGAGVTLLAVAVHLAGLTERFELLVFDWEVRHVSRTPASDRILHIDIDDDALDRVGSWPWPRDLQAELVSILHELGASHIVLDIVFSEPKPREVRLPELDPYAELEGDIEQIGELSSENVVDPDEELARAIRSAGTVYLAMYYEEPAGHGGPALHRRDAGVTQERIAAALRADFELDVEALSDRLGVAQHEIEAVLAGVKRRVARELVHEVMRDAAGKEHSAREVHERLLSTPFDRQTADRADVLAAYVHERSLEALRRQLQPVPAALHGKLPIVNEIVPPIRGVGAEAHRIGFVTFKPDFDGGMRHVPLLLEWDGRMIEQLALTVARDVLDIQTEDLSIDETGNLRIAARGDRPGMRIQLDGQGQMLVNWHVTGRRWENCFQHLPATQFMQIRDCRKGIRENDLRKRWAIGEALAKIKEPTGFALYRDRVNRLLHLERRLRESEWKREPADPGLEALRAERDELQHLVATDEAESAELINEEWEVLRAEPDPNDPAIAEDYQRFKEAHALIADRVAELDRVNAAIRDEEQRLRTKLRPLVDRKICFVGYTATAVADMVTSPAYHRMPGVLVHSNVLNGFLQNAFLRWSPRWLQAGVILLLGLTMTVVTGVKGPRASLAVVLSTIAAFFALNAWVVFGRMDHWLRLLTALVVVFVVWALIVLVRYLVTDRERRRFSKAVAQYVSPAMARRIASEAERLDLSPASAEVSCYFSDLGGFTTIAERLGPEGTKTVLNPYLESMSAVLHRREALINKFNGDGIFAFFNPPILPCAGHERAACEAAIDSQLALSDLKRRYDHHPLACEFASLQMRVGIASGSVFVGDYGSEAKLDYTCVGDTVNLASRLESANKQFGSRVLVSGKTRRSAGDRFVYRPIGAVRVKGQTVAVDVFELLGRVGEVNGELERFAECFAAGVEAFAARAWTEAAGRFAACLALRPGDAVTRRYLELVGEYQHSPPPDDWRPSIELTEK